MSFLASASLAVLVLFPAREAVALDKPTGEVILTVRGKISETNADGRAEFDMAMLDKLKSRSAAMQTPWTQGKAQFSGPLFREVLAAVGAKGASLKIRALNDYVAYVPYADATELQTILATRLNDAPMSVRDKGPLFLIYPFDLDPALYNEKYFSRSVWQISEIEVRG
jgi:hypothetical protein